MNYGKKVKYNQKSVPCFREYSEEDSINWFSCKLGTPLAFSCAI